jgi:hypothetical protein
MSSNSSPARIKPIGDALALHEIIASVRQLSYMKQHSNALLDTLNVKLEITYARAPVGRQAKRQTYELQRAEKPDPVVRERLLEKLIWRGWRFHAVVEHGQPFLNGVCRFIQTYQMPLQESRKDTHWGKIDLIGATTDSLPVVIELKQEAATDTPLRMLVEGLAYACAVRKAWNEGWLRTEWAVAMKQNGLYQEPEKVLVKVPVILLAPMDFWKRAMGITGKRTSGKVREDAWPVFLELVRKCAVHGFPISFVQFEIDRANDPGVTKVVNVSEVCLPGMEVARRTAKAEPCESNTVANDCR